MTASAESFPSLDDVLVYLALAAALPFAAWFLFERFAALMAKIITRFTSRSDPVVATVRGGSEGMVGEVGVVRKPLGAPDQPRGKVFVRGELWDAVPAPAEDGGRELSPGHRVRVEGVDGLTLRVAPLADTGTDTNTDTDTDTDTAAAEAESPTRRAVRSA